MASPGVATTWLQTPSFSNCYNDLKTRKNTSGNLLRKHCGKKNCGATIAALHQNRPVSWVESLFQRALRYFLSWGSANYDESRFPEPEKLDIFRRNAGTHTAFGAGIHRCVGNMLARMEMKCAFKALLDNFESLQLKCAPEEVELDASVVLRGPKHLPTRFSRA